MGKPTGFMEYPRELPLARLPAERVHDWHEFHDHADDALLRKQGARCMDCGVPFCHTGTLIEGMASGCPINNLIPEWNDLVYRGLWHEALERLHKTNNFPEFTGRVCPAPCEGSCVLGINEPPVTIKTIECAIVDRGFEEGWIVARAAADAHRQEGRRRRLRARRAGLPPPSSTGPAIWVTVFERADRIGGLLMYGIPNMKLDKSIVQRRVDLLAAEGVAFVTNCEVGKDYPADEAAQGVRRRRAVRRRHAAQRLLRQDRGPQPQGHPLRDGVPARQHQEPARQRATKTAITSRAKDKDVIVIGGGDTGTDCVGTAHAARLPQPAAARDRAASRRWSGPPDNPWPQWPKVYKLDYGQEEAEALFGDDPREYADPDDEVRRRRRAATSRSCTRSGSSGSRTTAGPMPRERSRHARRCCPPSWCCWRWASAGRRTSCSTSSASRRTPRTNAKAEHGKFATSVPGVFAAGDMRRGQSLVVWAINEGRGAARECDRWLMGETALP